MQDKDVIISEKILRYCKQISETHKEFNNDKNLFLDTERGFIYQNAVSMPLQQIGELAKSYSDEFIKSNSGIPWKEIKGMRDYFAHDYGEMNRKEIWNSSHEGIDAIRALLEQVLKSDQ